MIVTDAGIEFDFALCSDSDERGRFTIAELQGHRLVDAEEFTGVTGLPPTDENVAIYVQTHEDELAEQAVEDGEQERREYCDPPDDDSEDWDESYV